MVLGMVFVNFPYPFPLKFENVLNLVMGLERASSVFN